MEDDSQFELERARQQLGITFSELWLRYFELGGMADALEIEAYLRGALRPTALDRDILAVALNERIAAKGGDHPIPYSNDDG